MKNLIKISLLSLALVFAASANAQLLPISMGIKGGVNLSNASITDVKTKGKAGFNAGVTLDINLPAHLAIMSGLEVTTKGAKYKGTDLTTNAMYLQLPVHLGYRIGLVPGVRAHFSIGPYFAQGIGGKTEIEGDKVKTFGDDGLKKFDWGLGIGVGVTFLGKIQVRAGYDHGFANVGRKYEVTSEPHNVIVDQKFRNRNAYLSAGFLFF